MASSSSSHALVPVTKYDLFISFRGAEIRDNFLSHLLQELRLNQIDVYVDERLQRGDEISPTLLQAIEESSISLVIFSKDYASSKWCMEEHVKIIECKEQHHRIVIPVFYKIDPSHVRHLRGPFEEAFGKHQERYKGNMVMVQSWRSALKTAADLSGFHYPSKYKDERELIEEIVEDVSDRLCNNLPSETRDDLVGIDEHLKLIEPLLAIESSEVRILGIWGMGGIGKTTIAKFVFDKYSSKYDGRCFLDNVREESQKHGGLTHLFQKLVSELLQDEKILLQGLSATRLNNVKRRLGKMEVFMVLDDVSSSEQLEHLIRKQIPLGQGSRVIITTREKQILRREHQIYEVKKLNFKNSLMLFCLNAFGKNYPEIGYENQSKSVVGYTNGVPLALKVLGSFLHSIDNIKAWNDELGKLKSDPNKEVFNALKLSYDGLDDKEKDIFLDIAFFFKGKDKDYVIRLLNSCGFRATIGIDSLLRKALISLSEDNRIEMHDLIEQMGWEIVRQEFIKDPGKRSRLRDPDDVYDVLKYNKGTNIIEGIVWDLSKTLNNRDLHLQVDTFKKMPKLRVLIAYGMPSNVHIPAELETFSDEMRYLEWMRYPLTSLPSSFCAEMLVEFSMPFSEVTKLWDGVQDLVNLEKINLWRCMQLEELPDLSKASKLREIDLTYCLSLRRVHPSILRTPTLEVLKLQCCKELKSLESEFQFEHLHELDVGGCSSLEEFSVMSEKIRSLDLRGSKIEVLNSSIFYLDELERFYLSSSRIKRLPDVLCFLTSLVELDLSGCTEIIELPNNIKALTRLTTLGIRDCCRLESLQELPSSLTRLDATNCTSLKTVSGVTAVSSFMWTWFSFQNCNSLDGPSRHWFKEVVRDTMRRYSTADLSTVASDGISGICYPGSEVPEWFKYRTRGASVSLELDQSADRLLGFFLCCVTSQLPYIFKGFYEIKSQCYLEDGERGGFQIAWRCVKVNQELNSDHVYTWCDNEKQIVDEIKKFRINDHCTTQRLKISLQFVIICRDENDEEIPTLSNAVIKEIGVYPIYSKWGEYELIDETKGLVGIDEQIECIESLLAVQSGKVQSLVIWGTSGIGKTTIAKVIFSKWSSQYEHCCFLENVTEISSLKHREQDWSGKVFIVLDNVNSSWEFEYQLGQFCVGLGPGSRVIVTSRDKQMLTHAEYKVQGLNRENSLELFCLNAFSTLHPETRYAMESEMAVSCAKGVPLVLKALGCFLRSRDLEALGSELRKLEPHPDKDIFDFLKWIYDYYGLDGSERNIFLDIAFFLEGRKRMMS